MEIFAEKNVCSRWLIPLLSAVAAFIVALVASISHLDGPPEPGDAHDYDMIAFCLRSGEGFGTHWSAAEWRRPYEEHPGNGVFRTLLKRTGDFQLTAYRPPLYPFLLAIWYEYFGREFWSWRVVALILYAITIGISVYIATAIGGVPSGIVTFGIALFDKTFFGLVPTFMTENLAAFLIVTMVAVTVAANSQSAHIIPRSIFISLCAGLLVLLRSALIVPSLFLLIVFFATTARSGASRSIRATCYGLFTLILTLAPWGLRNADVTGTWRLAMGTQGAINALEAYSDLAYQRWGIWHGDNTPSIDASADMDAFSLEVRSAKAGLAEASAWQQSNIERLPTLFLRKCWALLFLTSTDFQKFLLMAGVVALFATRRSHGTRILAVPILGVVISAGLSWVVVNGRFLLPAHPELWIVTSLLISNFGAQLHIESKKWSV